MPGSNGDGSDDDSDNQVVLNRPPGHVVYREYNDEYPTRNYIVAQNGVLAATPSTIVNCYISPWEQLRDAGRQLLVPSGYPRSVSKDYMHFQLWDGIQIFFLTLIGTLSMNVILVGLEFTELAAWTNGAAITWILRELSMFAARTYYFTQWVNRLQMGCEYKKWRTISCVLSGLSVCVELLLYKTLRPVSVILVLCFAMVIRTVANMYDRITVGLILQHQALENNVIDVQKKNDRQSICARILGICVAIFLIHNFELEEYTHIQTVYISLTACHIYAGYKAMDTLQLRTLNFQRFAVLLRMYLVGGRVYSPQQVNPHDGVIQDTRIDVQKLCGYTIKLGESIAASDFPSLSDLVLLCRAYEGHKYLLHINEDSRTVYICLRRDSTALDEIRAFYQAVLLAIATCILTSTYLPILERYPRRTVYPLRQLRISVMQCCARVGVLNTCSKCVNYDCGFYVAMLVAELMTCRDFPRLLVGLIDAEWDTSHHHLTRGGYTANWSGRKYQDNSDDHLVEFFSKIGTLTQYECLSHPKSTNNFITDQ